MSLLRVLGRPMLASIFIAGGLDTLRNPHRVAGLAEPVVRPVTGRISALPDRTEDSVRLNGAVQVAAGLLLATGRMSRPAALAIAATLVPTTLAAHRSLGGGGRRRQVPAPDPLPQEPRPARRAADRGGRHRVPALGAVARPARRPRPSPRGPHRPARLQGRRGTRRGGRTRPRQAVPLTGSGAGALPADPSRKPPCEQPHSRGQVPRGCGFLTPGPSRALTRWQGLGVPSATMVRARSGAGNRRAAQPASAFPRPLSRAPWGSSPSSAPCLPHPPRPGRIPVALAFPPAPRHALVVRRELRVQRRYLDAADRAEPAGPPDHRVRRGHRPVHVRPGGPGPADERARRRGRRPLAAQADRRRQPGPAGRHRLHHGHPGGAGPARHDHPDGAGRRHRHGRHRRQSGLRPARQRPRPRRGPALRHRRRRAGLQRGAARGRGPGRRDGRLPRDGGGLLRQRLLLPLRDGGHPVPAPGGGRGPAGHRAGGQALQVRHGCPRGPGLLRPPPAAARARRGDRHRGGLRPQLRPHPRRPRHRPARGRGGSLRHGVHRPAAGGIVGAVLGARLRRPSVRLVGALAATGALLQIAAGLSPSLAVLLVLVLPMAVVESVSDTAGTAVLQTDPPAHLRGRVLGVWGSIGTVWGLGGPRPSASSWNWRARAAP